MSYHAEHHDAGALEQRVHAWVPSRADKHTTLDEIKGQCLCCDATGTWCAAGGEGGGGVGSGEEGAPADAEEFVQNMTSDASASKDPTATLTCRGGSKLGVQSVLMGSFVAVWPRFPWLPKAKSSRRNARRRAPCPSVLRCWTSNVTRCGTDDNQTVPSEQFIFIWRREGLDGRSADRCCRYH